MTLKETGEAHTRLASATSRQSRRLPTRASSAG